ncbi:MAG: 30S ribosomal protein S2, partial [Terriglobales bacterium]
FTSKISESIAEGVHARDDKQMADIQAVAAPEVVAEVEGAEAQLSGVAAEREPVAVAGVDGTGPEGEEIRMEDVLGKGTRKRPTAATEDVDELQAETRRF